MLTFCLFLYVTERESESCGQIKLARAASIKAEIVHRSCVGELMCCAGADLCWVSCESMWFTVHRSLFLFLHTSVCVTGLNTCVGRPLSDPGGLADRRRPCSPLTPACCSPSPCFSTDCHLSRLLCYCNA